MIVVFPDHTRLLFGHPLFLVIEVTFASFSCLSRLFQVFAVAHNSLLFPVSQHNYRFLMIQTLTLCKLGNFHDFLLSADFF